MALLSVSGCGLGSSGATAALRLLNGVSGNTVDFTVGGVSIATGVSFAGISPYVYVSTGSNDFNAYTSGSGNSVVPTVTMNLNTGIYTAVATGIPGNTATPPTFQLFTDDNTLPPTNAIKVRVINSSPDAGPVDFSLNSSPPLATAITYGSASPYTQTAPGVYTLNFYKAGTTTLVATKAAQTLNGGGVFTVFLVGLVGNNSATVVGQLDASH